MSAYINTRSYPLPYDKSQPYTCIVFVTNQKPLKYEWVKSPLKLINYLEGKGYTITAVNVYHRKSNTFLTQLKPC